MAVTKELRAFVRQLKALDATAMTSLVERRHPEYADQKSHWDFVEATFRGGREWFAGNIFKYSKEGDTEYKERVQRAYRFPHTRETVNLLNKYIFKGKIVRNLEDASDAVQEFWKVATIQRRSIEDFMPMVSERQSVFGRVWVVVDSNAPAGDYTAMEAKEGGFRTYAYTMRPQDVLDLARSSDGELLWIKLRERHRDDADILSSGAVTVRYKYWTRDFWALIEETRDNSGNTLYQVIAAGEHALGRVPVFSSDHSPSENPYVASGLIDDISYLDRAVANYLSNLDAIIQDQSFSQLVMPAQGLMPGDDEHDKLLELGTKRIFTYDGQSPVPPQYIAPDPKQAGMILSVINKIINEIYSSVGMAGERTKEDNSVGIDNSSGVAKAFDFGRLDTMLAAKARALQAAENTLCELVDLWNGKKVEQGDYDLVHYPESFDIRGLADELALGQQLSLLQAPDEVRRQQMEIIVDKLFPHLGETLIAKIKAELKTWPPEPEPLDSTSSPSAFRENRQGQNTGGSED